jgi:uncharacterized membrane protein
MATTADSTSTALASAPTPHDWLRRISAALALIGVLISGYLVWSEVTNVATICPQTGGFNCDLVQNSIYSRVGPIPVAVLGLAGYLAILLGLMLETRVLLLVERGRLIMFGLTLIGFLFSLYLTAMEAFVLHAWCVWCVGSAITMTLLFIVSFVRLWREISQAGAEEELA